jgi:hypothetical protein
MRVGVLAYCSACNFGAQLQLLSTYYYLLNFRCDPIVVDWIPRDLLEKYNKNCRKDVLDVFSLERERLWKQTRRCSTDDEIASVINEYQIDAIIIGSDAVAQHRSLFERIKFPTRRFISISHPSSDTLFPNPFWGTFNRFLDRPIPIAAMSVSSQDSRYAYFGGKTRKEMAKYVHQYKYLSVRDSWTASMFQSILGKGHRPLVTPDPVFGFNDNAGHLVPNEQYIRNKFQLPKEYIIVSFHDKIVDNNWLATFCNLCHSQGLTCINLPYADVEGVGNVDIDIKLPITPLEWYAIIKYSKGYVGENMHPIVVCLHNKIPFFSFDNYGIKYLNGIITSDKSSKILHILKEAGLEKSRVSCISKCPFIPSPKEVFDNVRLIDVNSLSSFSERYNRSYHSMMNSILNSIRS